MAYTGVQLLSLPIFGTTILPTPVLVLFTVLVVIVIDERRQLHRRPRRARRRRRRHRGARLLHLQLPSCPARSCRPTCLDRALISAALVGCCAGFLPHNFHPARLFMGDSGALTLGLLLSAATITLTGQRRPADVHCANQVLAAFLPILVPLAVLLLPFLDMVLAVVRRTRAGQRPWQPDAMHLHHRMLRIGHGHRRAVLILYLWAAIVALGSVSFVIWDGPRPLAVVGAGRRDGRRAHRLAAAVEAVRTLVIAFTST